MTSTSCSRCSLPQWRGYFASLLIWLLVALVTPAPMYLRGVALERARVLQGRIPEHLRERLPRNVA